MRQFLINNFSWIVLLFIAGLLTVYFLSRPQVQLAGDIAEYYGVTESVLSHGGVDLTARDQVSLEKRLHAAYFRDPGYYIEGVDGKQYPVHFFFYSILAIPARVVLEIFGADPLKSLAITNVFLATGVLAIIFRFFVKNWFSRVVLLSLFFLSPLLFFFAWPGPDMYYVALILLALYLFGAKKYLLASVVAGFASWHSQPLLIVALGFLAYAWFLIVKDRSRDWIFKAASLAVKTGFILLLLAIPYIYNIYAFGVLTPWTVLQDGWTQNYGFGVQNMGIKRLWEQFFDLNMGLFWYAPAILLFGLYWFGKSIKKKKLGLIFLPIVVIGAFVYQTNPAWHFGTAGYGPTRHIIFVLPFLIFFIVRYLRPQLLHRVILGLIVLSQLLILPLNGFVMPNFEHSLQNSPFARFVLDRYPSLYNPTPEIFVDRTNHTDLGHLTSAFYKSDGECQKAFVLPEEQGRLIAECGFVPIDSWFDISREGRYVNYDGAF